MTLHERANKTAQTANGPSSSVAPLQRKCACGQHMVAGGDCAACRKKKMRVQRSASGRHSPTHAPPIVHEVLRSPGRPLDAATQSFMESRFSRDFSRVRVHTDTRAAHSAEAVGSLAYTVGTDIVFGPGRYAPESDAGRRLLAHELVHAAQQGEGSSSTKALAISDVGDAHEREADRIASRVTEGEAGPPVQPEQGSATSLQRYSFGSGAGPDFGGGDRLVPVPDDQRARVEQALGIVSRVVNNPRDYPECPRFFRTNCPGGSANAVYDAFNRAVVWFNEGAPAGRGGVTAGLGGQNIGYTDLTYRIGRWAMAATFIHELMHVCGQGSHDLGDQAKNACGRLPDIISLRPKIEISNPIR